jgi:hypothetical protein
MDIISHVTWRTASYSGSNGGGCVEAGVWRTASYSGSNGGECVQVASTAPALVAVRDSKDPDGPKLAFTPAGWQAFTRRVKTASTARG